MIVVFDAGGTNVRVAYSRDGATFDEPIIEKTIHHRTKGPHRLLELIEEAAGKKPIQKIIGGIAGSLDSGHTRIIHSPNISEWENYPIATTLSQHFMCPVRLENDTALVGLGEATFGAGKSKDIVVYVTISTGVGGVRITEGTIDANVNGFEPGHQILDWKTKETLEGLISGKANEKKFQTKITEIPESAWESIAEKLAVGIYNLNLIWSPNCIVLGGSMITKKIGIDIDRVLFHLQKLPNVFSRQPEIIKASLGDLGGLYGGLTLNKHL